MEKSATNEVSITKISIKKENLNDDIKEFAETAMNELLGWYGYENTRDDLKILKRCRSHSASNNSSDQEPPKFPEGCGWCGKSVDENTCLTSASATFCSELCFSQSRRASFKKNKSCDWCRHVRHTVSYVDFQDGASQLQFCSDKCLNQYKMHIFCRETRAHLELHPHLRSEESTSGTLITPDLWMKNCKSPESQTSLSPKSLSPKPTEKPLQTSPLPLIITKHPFKLNNLNEKEQRHSLKITKKTRKRLPATVTCRDFSKVLEAEAMPQDLRVTKHSADSEEVPKCPERVQNTFPERHLGISSARTRVPNQYCSQPNLLETQPCPSILRKTFDDVLPPPTIIVPYPIVLPLPFPIPIPIPIPLQKTDIAADKSKVIKKDAESQTENNCQPDDTNSVTSLVSDGHNTSQGEIVDVVALEKEELEDEQKNSGRYLRKRKRKTCDSGSNSKYGKVLVSKSQGLKSSKKFVST